MENDSRLLNFQDQEIRRRDRFLKLEQPLPLESIAIVLNNAIKLQVDDDLYTSIRNKIT